MSEKMEMDVKGEDNTAYNHIDDESTEPQACDKDVELNIQDSHTDTDVDNDDAVEDTTGENEGFRYDPKTGDIIFQKRPFNNSNPCSKGVAFLQTVIKEFYREYKRPIWTIIGCILLVAYFGYTIYCFVKSDLDDEGSMRLLVCTIIGVVLLCLHLCQSQLEPVYHAVQTFKTSPKYNKLRFAIQWALYIVSTVATVTLIIVLVARDTPENLMSLLGLAALIVICYVTSYSPAMIQWHPVFWGFSLQFYFAVIILKTRWGYEAFNWLGDRVTEFLAYSDEGAKFVFGDYGSLRFHVGTTFNIEKATQSDGSELPLTSLLLKEGSTVAFNAVFAFHFFAFKVLPVVIFFSSFIGILFYLGVMKFVVKNIGYFLSFCLGTTPAESLNAAGNIFVGMTESPLLIRPFIGKMTSSELHAVMTGGFATIAGSVLGVYIGFGVPANHLLSASVMSAPAALAISKLTYPEVEIPIITEDDYNKVENSKENNVIEAACNGAIMAGKIAGAIVVNVIAFLSLLKFLNATLTWFGDRAGVDELTFEFLCSYVLYPVALFMGTDRSDCRQVAELIGIKTFTNEFIAFDKLSVLLNNRVKFDEYTQNVNYTWHRDGDHIYLDEWNNQKLVKGILDPRSEVIATYALCGFSNFGSMGILLGALSAIAPNRTPTMAKLVLRAMIAGNIACFFTACIAGLFYEKFE